MEGRFPDEELQQMLDDMATQRSFQSWDSLTEMLFFAKLVNLLVQNVPMIWNGNNTAWKLKFFYSVF